MYVLAGATDMPMLRWNWLQQKLIIMGMQIAPTVRYIEVLLYQLLKCTTRSSECEGRVHNMVMW